MSKRKVNGNTPLMIMLELVYAAQPLTLSELSRQVGIDRQLVRYHIPRLLKEGLLLEVGHDKIKRYSPQPIFIDPALIEELKNTFTPIFSKIGGNLIFDKDADVEQVLRNNLLLYMNMIENVL